MKVIGHKEVEAVLKLDGPSRFKYFVKWVVDGRRAWGLWNDGWALSEDDDGVTVFPLWPAREYAELCRTDQWADFQPEEIPLEDLLNVLAPMFIEEGTRPGIFPTPVGKGVIPTVDELRAALREEMKRYELPHPRARLRDFLGATPQHPSNRLTPPGR